MFDDDPIDTSAADPSDPVTAQPDEATGGQQHRRRAAFRPAGAPAPLTADFSAVEAVAAVGTAGSPGAVAVIATRTVALFQPPPDVPALRSKRRAERDDADDMERDDDGADDEVFPEEGDDVGDDEDAAEDSEGSDSGEGAPRRRRRRGGRRRRKPTSAQAAGQQDGLPTTADSAEARGDDAGGGDEDDHRNGDDADGEDVDEAGSHRRRRRRRREGIDARDAGGDDPPNTVVHVRESRTGGDEVTAVRGSTRLEAKKQRRREGRDAGRRRPPILTEAEFLARRDSVERRMLVRAVGDRTQIAVLEDGVLAEHYVSRNISSSVLGNVYLGRVQNVLPSMEAAFVDIGRGRNAVLYAGEVNWQAAGLSGSPKRIELALKSGDSVLVQVTKDPVGHKGARLTSQISLAGRHLVFVPGGSMTGISRRLPEKERARLKKLLRAALPEGAGVIVRTAAEGATEEQINSDVARLTSIWAEIETAAKSAKAPQLLHSEPDLAIRVVRDIFNEDFASLVASGEAVAEQIEGYVNSISPELAQRVSRWTSPEDLFASNRVDEQLAKALDRKVWLPSGGSLVIDRTEAMTVVDVNTGKFTGSGGNLEETVTRNNLEAAEEIVRQLRLRDIGGIIVIDFIDMVLERNRDLVLRRLVECLGRDRTKHQVAEVTSLGLVQMTRKRIGQGLLETFSEICETCNGRGIRVSTHPVDRPLDTDVSPRRRQRPPGPIPGAPTPSSQRLVEEPPAGTGETESAGPDELLVDDELDDAAAGVVDLESEDTELEAPSLADLDEDLDELEIEDDEDDESEEDDDELDDEDDESEEDDDELDDEDDESEEDDDELDDEDDESEEDDDELDDEDDDADHDGQPGHGHL